MLVSPPEESQKQKELAKAEMQKVLKEKVQLMADLHSVEKSFSDLFKRFEKQKENEESLKKCVEDYIERVEEEAQKYQALKAQAEEKLQQASEEIAQEGPDGRSGAAGGPEEGADVCPLSEEGGGAED